VDGSVPGGCGSEAQLGRSVLVASLDAYGRCNHDVKLGRVALPHHRCLGSFGVIASRASPDGDGLGVVVERAEKWQVEQDGLCAPSQSIQ